VNLSTAIATTMKPFNNIENENSTIASMREKRRNLMRT
jgi:hypothetical protein